MAQLSPAMAAEKAKEAKQAAATHHKPELAGVKTKAS
jgi:hypothetical protein